jgi:hypothetical protein
MIEVYYKKPIDLAREGSITTHISNFGGEVTFREDDSRDSVCLTAEFGNWESAHGAASRLRDSGEHVEGPMDYGDE